MQKRNNTKQKELIMNVLKQSTGSHITAAEIIDTLSQSEEAVGKATVYRYLRELEQAGQLKKYLLAESPAACYQLIGKHNRCNEHYHLRCEGCGELVHFQSELMSILSKSVLQKQGFAIDGGKTVFYGTCARCGKAKESV